MASANRVGPVGGRLHQREAAGNVARDAVPGDEHQPELGLGGQVAQRRRLAERQRRLGLLAGTIKGTAELEPQARIVRRRGDALGAHQDRRVRVHDRLPDPFRDAVHVVRAGGEPVARRDGLLRAQRRLRRRQRHRWHFHVHVRRHPQVLRLLQARRLFQVSRHGRARLLRVRPARRVRQRSGHGFGETGCARARLALAQVGDKLGVMRIERIAGSQPVEQGAQVDDRHAADALAVAKVQGDVAARMQLDDVDQRIQRRADARDPLRTVR